MRHLRRVPGRRAHAESFCFRRRPPLHLMTELKTFCVSTSFASPANPSPFAFSSNHCALSNKMPVPRANSPPPPSPRLLQPYELQAPSIPFPPQARVIVQVFTTSGGTFSYEYFTMPTFVQTTQVPAMIAPPLPPPPPAVAYVSRPMLVYGPSMPFQAVPEGLSYPCLAPPASLDLPACSSGSRRSVGVQTDGTATGEVDVQTDAGAIVPQRCSSPNARPSGIQGKLWCPSPTRPTEKRVPGAAQTSKSAAKSASQPRADGPSTCAPQASAVAPKISSLAGGEKPTESQTPASTLQASQVVPESNSPVAPERKPRRIRRRRRCPKRESCDTTDVERSESPSSSASQQARNDPGPLVTEDRPDNRGDSQEDIVRRARVSADPGLAKTRNGK